MVCLVVFWICLFDVVCLVVSLEFVGLGCMLVLIMLVYL